MPDAAPIDSLLDILELIERVDRQTGNLTREAFLDVQDVQECDGVSSSGDRRGVEEP